MKWRNRHAVNAVQVGHSSLIQIFQLLKNLLEKTSIVIPTKPVKARGGIFFTGVCCEGFLDCARNDSFKIGLKRLRKMRFKDSLQTFVQDQLLGRCNPIHYHTNQKS